MEITSREPVYEHLEPSFFYYLNFCGILIRFGRFPSMFCLYKYLGWLKKISWSVICRVGIAPGCQSTSKMAALFDFNTPYNLLNCLYSYYHYLLQLVILHYRWHVLCDIMHRNICVKIKISCHGISLNYSSFYIFFINSCEFLCLVLRICLTDIYVSIMKFDPGLNDDGLVFLVLLTTAIMQHTPLPKFFHRI